MKVAVLGAGIVGVTTAYELAVDGHDVTVFERGSTVASGTSFANAGVVAPGYVTPWAAPGMVWKVVSHLASRHTPVRLGWGAAAQLPWLWRWWRACRPAEHQRNRARLYRLARYSHDRLLALTEGLGLEHERSKGYLVLLRTVADLRRAHDGLKQLTDLGVPAHLLDADAARRVEPALNPGTPLRAAIHLPDDIVANCRQFAHQLRGEAERRGARFAFEREVTAIGGRGPVTLAWRDGSTAATRHEEADAVVVCAGVDSAALLRPLGLRLPLLPVWGYSVTAPLRHRDEHPDPGPASGVMDERYKVAITRMGQRVRVAGSAELGGRADRFHAGAMDTLYRVLDDWYPGAAVLAKAQRWKGARPMLPDGPPLVGPGPVPGVWLNLGHGSSGWALAAGSARLLADRLAGRTPAIDVEGLGIERLA